MWMRTRVRNGQKSPSIELGVGAAADSAQQKHMWLCSVLYKTCEKIVSPLGIVSVTVSVDQFSSLDQQSCQEQLNARTRTAIATMLFEQGIISLSRRIACSD